MNSNQASALHLWNLIHAKPISPSTPAVSLKLTRFLSEKQINLPPSVSHRVCPHCGIVSVPGLTMLSSIVYGTKGGVNQINYRKKKNIRAARSLVYTCLGCDKRETIEANLVNESAPAIESTTPPFTAKWTSPAKIDTNAKSRERQKKRKQNSLTSLLANKKKNDQEKDRLNSLNLMEFMK